jgi:hypothetical protein
LGDLHLQVGSQSIDAGSNGAVPPDTLDLDEDGDTSEPIPYCPDRKLRILNGVVDMGAYEYVLPIPGDFDSDGDVDRDDFNEFEDCASGPAIPYTGDCADKDFDSDNDVDQNDFAIFQRCYSGTNNAGDSNCAN